MNKTKRPIQCATCGNLSDGDCGDCKAYSNWVPKQRDIRIVTIDADELMDLRRNGMCIVDGKPARIIRRLAVAPRGTVRYEVEIVKDVISCKDCAKWTGLDNGYGRCPDISLGQISGDSGACDSFVKRKRSSCGHCVNWKPPVSVDSKIGVCQISGLPAHNSSVSCTEFKPKFETVLDPTSREHAPKIAGRVLSWDDIEVKIDGTPIKSKIKRECTSCSHFTKREFCLRHGRFTKRKHVCEQWLEGKQERKCTTCKKYKISCFGWDVPVTCKEWEQRPNYPRMAEPGELVDPDLLLVRQIVALFEEFNLANRVKAAKRITRWALEFCAEEFEQDDP